MLEDNSSDDNVFRLPVNGDVTSLDSEQASSRPVQEVNFLQQPDLDPVEQKIWQDSMVGQEQQLIAEGAGYLDWQHDRNYFNEAPAGLSPQEIEKQKRESGTRATEIARNAAGQVLPFRRAASTDDEDFSLPDRIAA